MTLHALSRGIAALTLGLAAVLPAQATVVDFEDLLPTLFSGSSVDSGGMSFASSGAGFSGVDNNAAFSFPLGNSSGQFLFGLNSDVLTMTQVGGGAFGLDGFDFSFVAPQLALGAGISAGMLHIEAITGAGLFTDDFDFGLSDANGLWNFLSVATAQLAAGVSSVSFSACIYDGNGGCSFADPLAQFAIDNVQIPEPGSAALALAALGLLGATRRRKSA